MTTVESAASDQTWGRWIIRRLAWWWKQVRMLYQVLVLVRFSLLLGVVCALVMLLNDQAQDVLRLLRRGCRLASRLVSSRRGVERRRRLVVGAGDVLFPLPQSGIRAARLPPSQGTAAARARGSLPPPYRAVHRQSRPVDFRQQTQLVQFRSYPLPLPLGRHPPRCAGQLGNDGAGCGSSSGRNGRLPGLPCNSLSTVGFRLCPPLLPFTPAIRRASPMASAARWHRCNPARSSAPLSPSATA